ncbi:MAG: hypothetical protein AB1411_11340 [Nitrospirota bacterium]
MLGVARCLLAAAVGWACPVVAVAELAESTAPHHPSPITDHGYHPLVAAFHVHSTASTGDLTLDQLAEQAERLGLDAIVLTDNFVLRYEYGLFPFRGNVRRTFTLPSVLEYGVDRFLADVAAAQARHPRVLLVPGVEVVPHYFWTGSLLDRNLTMHNSQKNILAVGLASREDYDALPVNGNPGSYRYDWRTVVSLSPGLLFIPAAWFWFRRTSRTTRIGVTAYRVERRYRAPALGLAVVAGLLLLNAWPLGRPVFSAYDDRLDYRPYQAFIDEVARRGGATIWSMPEARDFNVHSYGPLGEVTVKTDPYPEALVRTTGYTGFGGVYQDTRTVMQPGGLWDLALTQYLSGQRTVPPFAVGEIAFHGINRDTRELDQVVTVFWVRDRSAAALVEALKTGRLYAVGQYQKGRGLRLDQFRVECEGGARWAESGEYLDPGTAGDLGVRLSVSATDQGAHPIAVTLVRSGEEIGRFTGTTPVSWLLGDPAVPVGRNAYYRILVEGEEMELLSNPVFVGPIHSDRS